MTQVFSDNVPKVRELMLQIQEMVDAGEVHVAQGGAYSSHTDMLAFEMSTYRSFRQGYVDDYSLLDFVAAKKCGTVACALGWCSLQLVPKDGLSWPEYAGSLLFTESKEIPNSIRYKAFEWVFGYEWAFTNANQPKDVVKRLDWLVANGLDELDRRLESCRPGHLIELWKEINYANRPNESGSSSGIDCQSD